MARKNNQSHGLLDQPITDQHETLTFAMREYTIRSSILREEEDVCVKMDDYFNLENYVNSPESHTSDTSGRNLSPSEFDEENETPNNVNNPNTEDTEMDSTEVTHALSGLIRSSIEPDAHSLDSRNSTESSQNANGDREASSVENLSVNRQVRNQQQQQVISRLIGGIPHSPGAISIVAGDEFNKEDSIVSKDLPQNSHRNKDGVTFDSVFKTPLCLSFSEDDFSSPFTHDSEGEKLLSLELLKEVGVDPKAKKFKDQYQRFSVKDGEVKSFVNKAFRHRLIKEHYQIFAKAVPKPNVKCMDWAKLDSTFQAELSFPDGKPKPELQRLNDEWALVKDHMRNFTDASGPLVALLHFWEAGRSPEPSQVVTAIKQSLLFMGNATAQLNHWRRKRVLEELGLYTALKSSLDAVPEEDEKLFGKAFMKKMVDENQKQKAAHKQVFEFKRRASGHYDTEDYYDKLSNSRKRRSDNQGTSGQKVKRQVSGPKKDDRSHQPFRTAAPGRQSRSNWSRGQTTQSRGRGRKFPSHDNRQESNNSK